MVWTSSIRVDNGLARVRAQTPKPNQSMDEKYRSNFDHLDHRFNRVRFNSDPILKSIYFSYLHNWTSMIFKPKLKLINFFNQFFYNLRTSIWPNLIFFTHLKFKILIILTQFLVQNIISYYDFFFIQYYIIIFNFCIEKSS